MSYLPQKTIGWEADHTTRGVKTSLVEARALMEELEQSFKSHNDFDNTQEEFCIKKTDDYVYYEYASDGWSYKISIEEVDEPTQLQV